MKFLFSLILTQVLIGLYWSVDNFEKFKWRDCGSRHLAYNKIEVEPHPIMLPGQMKLSMSINMTRSINGPLRAKINLGMGRKQMKIQMPCVKTKLGDLEMATGTCVYEDTCNEFFLPFVKFTGCPKELSDVIECSCPFKLKKDNFEVNDLVMELTKLTQSQLKSANGTYEARIQLEDLDGFISCHIFYFTTRSN